MAPCQKSFRREDRFQALAGKSQKNRPRSVKMERLTGPLQPPACKPESPDLLMAIGTQPGARPPHIKNRF
jgi:hypothetical protein